MSVSYHIVNYKDSVMYIPDSESFCSCLTETFGFRKAPRDPSGKGLVFSSCYCAATDREVVLRRRVWWDVLGHWARGCQSVSFSLCFASSLELRVSSTMHAHHDGLPYHRPKRHGPAHHGLKPLELSAEMILLSCVD